MEKYRVRSPIGDAPVYHLAATDSTMLVARELVQAGAPSGVVVLTDYQRAGRGRLPGRKWVSRPGESLMFTVAIEVEHPLAMPLRAGLAVAVALESMCGLAAEIKWPNDVLVSGRKICGVLCEYSSPWLYAGVGINLAQREFPAELADSATSVAIEMASMAGGGRNPASVSDGPVSGFPVPDRDALLLRILGHLADSGRRWQPEVAHRLWRMGEAVRIVVPDGSAIDGTITGIDDDGALVISRAGSSTRIIAGELQR